MENSQPSIKRAGWYKGWSVERYICEGRGIIAHGPTPKAAMTFWWLAQNPWPKTRSGARKRMFSSLYDEAHGGIFGYEIRPQRDGRVYVPLEANENGKDLSGMERTQD